MAALIQSKGAVLSKGSSFSLIHKSLSRFKFFRNCLEISLKGSYQLAAAGGIKIIYLSFTNCNVGQ